MILVNVMPFLYEALFDFLVFWFAINAIFHLFIYKGIVVENHRAIKRYCDFLTYKYNSDKLDDSIILFVIEYLTAFGNKQPKFKQIENVVRNIDPSKGFTDFIGSLNDRQHQICIEACSHVYSHYLIQKIPSFVIFLPLISHTITKRYETKAVWLHLVYYVFLAEKNNEIRE